MTQVLVLVPPTQNTIYGVFLKFFAIYCVKLKSRYFKPIEKCCLF